MAEAYSKNMGDEFGHHLNRHRPLDLVLVARQCHGDLACEADRIGAFAASFSLLKKRYMDASSATEISQALKALQSSCRTVGAHEVVRLSLKALESLELGGMPCEEDVDDLSFALEDLEQFLSHILR